MSDKRISPAKAWKHFLQAHREQILRCQADVLTATRDCKTIEEAAKAAIETSARWQQTQIYAGMIQQIEDMTDEGGEE